MTAVVLLVISGIVEHDETIILFMWTAVVLLVHIHYGVSVVSIFICYECFALLLMFQHVNSLMNDIQLVSFLT